LIFGGKNPDFYIRPQMTCMAQTCLSKVAGPEGRRRESRSRHLPRSGGATEVPAIVGGFSS